MSEPTIHRLSPGGLDENIYSARLSPPEVRWGPARAAARAGPDRQ